MFDNPKPTTMKKYIRLPEEVEAIEFTLQMLNDIHTKHLNENRFSNSLHSFTCSIPGAPGIQALYRQGQVLINTGAGFVPVSIGHYIVRQKDGSCFTCTANVFKEKHKMNEGIETVVLPKKVLSIFKQLTFWFGQRPPGSIENRIAMEAKEALDFCQPINTERHPPTIFRVKTNTKWQCGKCSWIGTHSDSADKTPVVNDLWLLVCPNCGNKSGFLKITEHPA